LANSKESKFLGTLLPSYPDFIPIEDAIRDKYNLSPLSPDDEPIKEFFLDGEPVSMSEFRKDIENRVRANLTFLPPEILKVYLPAKAFSLSQTQIQTQAQLDKFGLLPDGLKSGIDSSLKFVEKVASIIILIVDPMIDSIVEMLGWYLLTGETQEIPNDWIGKVTSIESFGTKLIMAMAGPMSNLDVITQQFRMEYKKAFGYYRSTVTKTAVSTAYYLRLKKSGKPWNYIFEEFLRLEPRVRLPKNRMSEEYPNAIKRARELLKSRMKRTEAIFEGLVGDKKR